MDNQNNNKGGLVNISKNILEGKIGPDEEVKRMTDASGQMNEDVVVHPNNFENVQSQSMVESARETANEELAQIKAYNDAILRQEKAQENKNKAKRTIIYVILGIFGAIVVIVLVWMLVNAIIAMQSPAGPGTDPTPVDPEKLDTVDGYKCETSKCYKAADLPDGRLIIRDTNFFIYNTETEESVMTNIENQEYHAIKPFKWGNQILVELDPESEKSGIYSITDNRQVIGFNYDTFYTDIKDDNYREQTWIEGQYIIAKLGGSYRLIRMYDGKEIIRGATRVFVHDKFCVSYEQGGERRLYTLEGKQFKVVPNGDLIYIKGSSAIYVEVEYEDFELFLASGEETSDTAEYDTLRDIDQEVLTKYLDKNYYKVSTK